MNTSQVRSLLRMALKEDIGRGDITTQILIPRKQRSEAFIVCKEAGIFAGGFVAREVFRLRDSSLQIKLLAKEGSRVKKSKKVIRIRGRVRSILEAERTALNFLGHLSGIATLTRQYVDKIRGTQAKIYDTRKTAPLWRAFEKCAVRSGGGENHRLGLWDEVLVKDNHWRAIWRILDQTKCRYFGERLRPVLRRKIPVEVEVRSLKELAHLLEGTFVPDRILLDNFSVKNLRRAVLFVDGLDYILRTRYGLRRKKPELEASGGVTLANVRSIAKTGVDRISVGRLTHSAPALDFSLKLAKVMSIFLILSILIRGIPPAFGVLEQENPIAETEKLDYQRVQNTQKGIPVDAHVIRRTNTLKMEFISDPAGAVRLKSIQLISPEGIIYEPREIYDVSEQAARNLGRLRPVPVPKAKRSKSSMGKVGSALLGAGLSTALSGLSSPSHSTAYSAGQYGAQAAKHSSSGLSTVGLVSGLAPLALSGKGNSGQESAGEVEWVEPKTAGTGIFSSVAEFECPAPSPSQEPWQLKAEMEDRKGSPLVYTFNFYPVPPLPSIWEKIWLTGPSSKLL